MNLPDASKIGWSASLTQAYACVYFCHSRAWREPGAEGNLSCRGAGEAAVSDQVVADESADSLEHREDFIAVRVHRTLAFGFLRELEPSREPL